MKKFIIFTLLLLTAHISFAATELYQVTAESGVNARSEPSTSKGYVLTTIKKGEIIPVYKIEDGWAQTRYHNKRLYVKVDYITLHKTSEQLQEEREDEEAYKRAHWYDPMNWGIIGWLIRWIVVPFFVFWYLMSIPFGMIAKVRSINNFFYSCICYLLMLIMIAIAVSILGNFDVYSGTAETFVLWAFGLIAGRSEIHSIKGERCPQCRYSDYSILESHISTLITTTITKYSNGSTSKHERRDSTLHTHHKCIHCGCEWWSED